MIQKIIDDSECEYNVELVFVAGDTPAMQSMGGFVESVGSATFPCRECKATKDDLVCLLSEEQCTRRNLSDLKRISELTESGPSVEGIKRKSRLLQYDFFDPIEQTPQDPMHIILEGLARRLLLYYLKEWAHTKRTDLLEINSRIKNFEYGMLHKGGKFKEIKITDLSKNELVISASQMKILVLVFPFMFYDIVDLKAKDFK